MFCRQSFNTRRRCPVNALIVYFLHRPCTSWLVTPHGWFNSSHPEMTELVGKECDVGRVVVSWSFWAARWTGWTMMAWHGSAWRSCCLLLLSDVWACHIIVREIKTCASVRNQWSVLVLLLPVTVLSKCLYKTKSLQKLELQGHQRAV